MCNPPPPTNTSKIHLHMKKFSLKTLPVEAGRTLIQSNLKESLTESVRKGREEIRSGSVPIARDTEEEGDIMSSEILHEELEPHTGNPEI